MSTYSSKPTVVNKPLSELTEKFSDFSFVQSQLDKLPEDKRQALGDVSFSTDSINIKTPQMGQVTLRVVERQPQAIVLAAEGSPVPMKLRVDFNPVSETSTEVTGTIDVDIPVIIKPMIGPTLQKAADKFGELFGSLA